MFYSLVELLNSIKVFPYYFISPLIYSYGNAAEQIFLVSREKKLKNKKIIILDYSYFCNFLKIKIANKNLLKDVVINNQKQRNKNVLFISLELLVFIEFFIRRSFIIFIKDRLKFTTKELDRFPYIGLKKLYSTNDTQKKYQFVNELAINQSHILLNDEAIKFCKKNLKNLNLEESKMVTLHVRDSNYKNDGSKRNYRNSDINNYIELINFYIQNDYKVIRIGEKNCNKINYNHKNFIDYPSSNFQSSLIDLYLIYISDLFIGTSSGPRSVAEMFTKPTLITNLDDLSDFPIKNSDRTIFKKFFKKDNKNKLDLTKLDEISYNLYNPELFLDDFVFEENSPEELYEAGKEFLNNYDKNLFSLSVNQIKFNEQLIQNFKFFNTENDKETLKFHIDSLKYFKRLKTMRGSICNYQLKN